MTETALKNAALAAPLAGLFQRYSLESTTQPRSIEAALAAPLMRGTSVYLTSLPGTTHDALVEAATKLARAGLNPVPHLAARSFSDAAALDHCLARLVAEAKVRQALVIGGDIDRPRGPLASSRDLIETGLLERHGIATAGLAAYPEGHPRVPGAILARELAAKVATLRERGIAPYVVTQFCFEAAPIAALLARLGEQLAGVPVHVGLAGPAKLSTLLRYAASCGIGNSLRALRRQASLTRLMTESGPEPVIAALAADPAARARVAQLHFFTFGGIERTARWAQAHGDRVLALRQERLGI